MLRRRREGKTRGVSTSDLSWRTRNTTIGTTGTGGMENEEHSSRKPGRNDCAWRSPRSKALAQINWPNCRISRNASMTVSEYSRMTAIRRLMREKPFARVAYRPDESGHAHARHPSPPPPKQTNRAIWCSLLLGVIRSSTFSTA